MVAKARMHIVGRSDMMESVHESMSGLHGVGLIDDSRMRRFDRLCGRTGPTTARSLGLRIKAARESSGMTREALRRAIGVADRTAISAMERGERTVRPEELVCLSESLQRDIEYFIDPFVVVGEAAFSWRGDVGLPSKDFAPYEQRVGSWLGMLRFLRNRMGESTNPFGSTLRLGRDAAFEEAEALGEAVCRTLNLGPVPANALLTQVETTLDIPVLFVDAIDMPGRTLSSASCHLPELVAILIDRGEQEARRNFELAHRLFHAMVPPEMGAAYLADKFAGGLLMPQASLESHVDRQRMHDVDHLEVAANQLRVEPAALAIRLFGSKWIDGATRDALRLRRSGLPKNTPKPFSTRFVELVRDGIDHGHVSSRKAARTLNLTTRDLEHLFAEHERQLAP